MIKRIVIVLAALLLVFGIVFGIKFLRLQRLAAHGPPPPPTVSTAHPVPQQWQSYIQAVGGLTASRGVYVSNEVEGKVTAIDFKSGQAATRGQALVRLDDSVDQAQLPGLEAQERLARIHLERERRLLKQHSVSRSDYDQARANLENAQAAVAAQRALIAQKHIVAPFTGLLGIRQVDLGQFLAKGTQIVSLQQLNPIYADFSLPEAQLTRITKGLEVQVRTPGFPDRVFSGEVLAIEPRVDTNTRNGAVRATLPNADDLLRPGMSATVRVVLPQRRRVLTLPAQAVTYNPYGDMVYVVERRNGKLIAASRQVQTGEVRDGRVEITKGLTPADEVVSAGQVKLRNGAALQVDNSVRLDKPPIGP